MKTRSLEVEDLVVELDKIAPEAGIARAHRGEARRTEVDRVHVVRAREVPVRETVRVGDTGAEKVAVAGLDFLDERSLCGVCQ